MNILKRLLSENEITIKRKDLLLVTKIIKYHTFFKQRQLINIIGLDNINTAERFTVRYIYNITGSGVRKIIKVKLNELERMDSITKYFNGAGWYEREIWDLYGIYFVNNSNLRRILNDYGFDGHPFRKDFPLTGYNQLQYDIAKKRLISTDVELSQMNRWNRVA